MVLTCSQAQSPVAEEITEAFKSEASSQPDLLLVDVSLQVSGSQECLVPLCKAGSAGNCFQVCCD